MIQPSLVLSIEAIELVAVTFKDDLTRECERCVRRGDNVSALGAIHGKEYIDRFVNSLRFRANSRIGMPARSRPIRIFRPANRKGGA